MRAEGGVTFSKSFQSVNEVREYPRRNQPIASERVEERICYAIRKGKSAILFEGDQFEASQPKINDECHGFLRMDFVGMTHKCIVPGFDETFGNRRG